ncbi:hypothetical protein GFY24_12240 [Nocardia sp. SYP-A9097]|uniref:hypothetical protein n=1 Tax=Nocardia sp. SYP-A9097 TaxID=2663237 RepID=UPI00129AD4B1|nr:hypothetical protein [Nocardia sp. SYP-A9097]MRH88202.1 hypothetical protein [Nocardia sp. SYP-A9097]
MSVSRKSVVSVGVAALAGMVSLGAGTASAADSALVNMSCIGLSPNVVDVPYSAQVIMSQYGLPPGVASFTVHTGASIWGGYGTTPTLTWTNTATGASGSVTGFSPMSSMFGSGSTVYFMNLPTGSGNVRIDLSVVNTGLIPVPPVNCSGNIDLA